MSHVCFSLLSKRAFISAEYAALARTWGLFGGALDSPQEPSIAALPTPPRSSTSLSNGQGETAAVEREGDGGERAFRLHPTVPVRGTPILRGRTNRSPDEVHSEGGEPRSPSQAQGAAYYNPRARAGGRGSGSGSGSGSEGSPELTMLFADEPEGKDSKAVGAGKGGAEALHGEPRSRWESGRSAARRSKVGV